MAYQEQCDGCGQSFNSDSLIYIELHDEILCDFCINDIINSLNKKAKKLENVIKVLQPKILKIANDAEYLEHIITMR